MPTDQPSLHPAPMRLALAPDWHVETISPGVDVERSGLYEWRIEGAGSYIGQYRRISRPRRQYARNVVRLLNDLPYRRGKPDGFRRIHRELVAALMEGRRIELIILENADKPGINDRERMLIVDRGCLNDPPFNRRSAGGDPRTAGTNQGEAPMSDEDRIARVARALCVADGHDPEEVIHLGADEVEAGGTTYSRDVLVPAWTTYASEARRMIAAVRALGLLE